MNIDFQAADLLMHGAVDRGTFPGAVLLVSVNGEILLHRAYGVADLFERRPMRCDTLFDLASLTKPLATTLAVLLLAQQEHLSLDRPCLTYWPAFQGPGKDQVTVRHLLSHCSGLPAWRPYHLLFAQIDPGIRTGLLQRAIAAEQLAAAPGERAEYSDLGFLVLQWMVECITGRPLDSYLDQALFEPLGLDLFFIRHAQPRQGSYAATELCPWRGKLLLGQVHDDNAYWMGGVAGHAGLFGTAKAVWRLLQGLLWVDAGTKGDGPFERKWVQRFFTRQTSGSSWALGFDTPSETASSAGRFFPGDSVGHLGYTGTSFWMDRSRGVIVILLTNRVHPSRYNTHIKAFRPRVHDAVIGALAGTTYDKVQG